MISVCYSGNAGIFHEIFLSALTMARRTKESIRIYILTMDLRHKNERFRPIEQERIDELTAMLKMYDPESSAVLLDITKQYESELGNGKNADSTYTPYTFCRLFLDSIPNIPDKLLYVDADTMFGGDVKELYDIELGDHEYGAVHDYMGRFFISPNYVNAGVLLLNMPLIKETELFIKARRMVARKKMFMPDQSALNKYAKNKLFLPEKFNAQRKMKEDTVIKHFCKGVKFFPIFHIYRIKPLEIEKIHRKLKIFKFDEDYEIFKKLYKQQKI